MSDGITDTARTDQQIFDAWRERETRKILKNISTDMLVDEISNRDGTKVFDLPNKDHHYALHITGKHGGLINGYGNPGPVKILVVKE